MQHSEAYVGMQVRFGRRNGESTLGEVTKVNRKNLKVRTLQSRGRNGRSSAGSVWSVPPALCTPVAGPVSSKPAAPATSTVREDLLKQFNIDAQLVLETYAKLSDRRDFFPSAGLEPDGDYDEAFAKFAADWWTRSI